MEGLAPSDLSDPENVVQIGVEPNRIDILTGVTGVTFDDAWRGRVPDRYGDVAIAYLGLEELLRAKRSAGRPRDLLDVQELERRHSAPD